ncbi:molybdopterin-dependent oxidoreductase [Sporomusa acidovorans]|uniref:Acetylene hydratase n=1 Tax=Sporomusa acidovorans (strain ATCC 49682 / DSM 3132 / Mol) TaxID=1123286 RepID=A0ABZ3J2F9_SPOA4|nr:molybdopterin-dependent oxidoreductase [Sporomusa acidovorans]OZC18079.1 acetylene hydratase [Sporomusa acidovorans DSM 3132]SDF72789.1 Anaerobic selenocysteine-containing dehydrogenase [Sporomusa acidovorans]
MSKVQWKEGEYTVTRTCQWTAPGCHDGCSVLYYTKGNKLVKVEGDPESKYNFGRLCMRCLASPELVNDPNRVKWPMKRAGERGENKWTRITWDEAFNLIEDKVRTIWKDYGPESIVTAIGTGRNTWSIVPKLTYDGFKSPNFSMGFLPGDSCYLPRAAAMGTMIGDFFIIDASQLDERRYDNPEWKLPEVVMIWGNNPLISNGDGFLGHWIVDMMKRGTKLIVVDPYLTWLASKADVWLQLRPGSDAALGLAMLNVMISEGLYDKEFVDKWTYGFDKLVARAAEYDLQKVENITWVPKEKIAAAARLFANAKPASVQWGLAVDTQVAGVSVANSICAMVAITGNLDVPGGQHIIRPAFGVSKIAHVASDWGWAEMPEEMRQKRLGVQEYPLFKYGLCATARGDSILETIETGRPYPIQMYWMESTNTFACCGAEAKRVYAALKKVPFNVCVDPVLTPSAVAFADLVLPAAMNVERDSLRTWWTPLRSISKVTQYEECKTDEEIALELGKRLNPEKFPWKNVEEMIDFALEPAGITFKELESKVMIWPEVHYKKYEKGLLREDGQPGFNTDTGMVNLYQECFDDWGLDPLPYHEEPPYSPISTPELMKEYPLILTSGSRPWEFFHSEHRQSGTLREFHPNPRLTLNPETAAKLGINEGDWVWIENKNGRVKQVARLDPGIDPRVVHGEHAWWFPEKEAAEPTLYGAFESNINVLTTQCTTGPTGYGAPLKNTICKIYKA